MEARDVEGELNSSDLLKWSKGVEAAVGMRRIKAISVEKSDGCFSCGPLMEHVSSGHTRLRTNYQFCLSVEILSFTPINRWMEVRSWLVLSQAWSLECDSQNLWENSRHGSTSTYCTVLVILTMEKQDKRIPGTSRPGSLGGKRKKKQVRQIPHM